LSWTDNQKKYLPALEKGAKWETKRGKFSTEVSGSGGGKVLHAKSVVKGKYDFKRILLTR